ncbi:MAG: hypothetical protein P1U58_01360 [Verrucomicrobiales bacterium]|nr:hypothetical protein [Verrucomicrobiales bacterium]
MSTRITLGNIGSPEHGVGSVTPSLVRTRAIELALADGRTAEEMTEHDYETARIELAPSHMIPSQNLSEGNSDTDQSLGADLVSEGLKEAQHDISVEAEIGRAELQR